MGMMDSSYSFEASEQLPAGMDLRPATHEDYDAVVSFTTDTWGERSDYIPDVFHEWVDQQGEDRLTLVADAGDDIAGLAQGVLLSPTESWGQGMRVNPAYRDQGIGSAIGQGLFEWARTQEAVCMRNMVFSWNEGGLGQSRAIGYEPVTEFRWLHPEPTPGDRPESITSNVDAAWSYWTTSTARGTLNGLGLDMDESWALRELTPDLLERAATETALFTRTTEDGTNGMAYRTRTYDRENEDGIEETWAEYGVAAWADLAAAESILRAIVVDASNCDADRTRVLIPETPRYVSDGAVLRHEISDYPDFVFGIDLTG